jgi:PAS domain-containing protein
MRQQEQNDNQTVSCESVKISIERNIAADDFAETYPYILRVEIISATMNAGYVYQIPVFVKYRGLEKTFGMDICGFRIEAKRPALLPNQANALLLGLINASRLPSYMFVARRAKALFPVYTINDEVMAITQGGPIFKHVELAKVREYLTDFLHAAHILGDQGLSDKLHVRGVSHRTLGLLRPVFYLKKRVAGETDFWAPVFQSSDGKIIYTYAASERHEVTRQYGNEVLQLHQLVAEALQTDRRLHDAFDLRPDRLMPGYWERLKSTLTKDGTLVVNGQVIEVYVNGRFTIAVESRPEEERYGLFLGSSKEVVRNRIALDFKRRRIV